MFFAGLLFSRLVATLLSKMINLTILGWINKLGGALVGVALGTLVASVVLLAISHVPGGESFKAEYQKSALGRGIYYAAPTVYQAARKLAGGKADEIWDRVMKEAAEAADEAKDKTQDAVDAAGRDARKKAEDAAKEALGQ